MTKYVRQMHAGYKTLHILSIKLNTTGYRWLQPTWETQNTEALTFRLSVYSQLN